MTKDEALDLALEALENSVDLVIEEADQAAKLYSNYETRLPKVRGLAMLATAHQDAITAIKQARALDKKAEKHMIYKTFEQWMNGDFLEVGEPRKKAYSKDDLLLVEMGWNYGYDAGRAVEQALDKKADNARELGLDYEPNLWRDAAIRIGEELSSVGPNGYYDMNPLEWLDWALDQQPRGKNSLSAAPVQEPVALDLALEALEIAQNNLAPSRGSARAYGDGELWDRYETAITAIKQARSAPVQEPVDLIERLKNPEDHYEFSDPKKANAVLMSLCQEAADALADIKQDLTPEHEPVAWQRKATMNFLKKPPENAEPGVWRPVYTTPTSAQRQWARLTDEEIYEIGFNTNIGGVQILKAYKAIEAKIKEKA